jgi:hypothetical protein
VSLLCRESTFYFYKNIKENIRLKVLSLAATLDARASSLAATPDQTIIFII